MGATIHGGERTVAYHRGLDRWSCGTSNKRASWPSAKSRPMNQSAQQVRGSTISNPARPTIRSAFMELCIFSKFMLRGSPKRSCDQIVSKCSSCRSCCSVGRCRAFTGTQKGAGVSPIGMLQDDGVSVSQRHACYGLAVTHFRGGASRLGQHCEIIWITLARKMP